MTKRLGLRVVVALSILVGIGCGSGSQDEDASAPMAQTPAAEAISQEEDRNIVIGERFSIASTTLGEERAYWVSLPASYKSSSPPQRYPVLYLLDGGAHFHSASGVVQFMSSGINGNRQIPEMIIVAILNTNRTRDLTPTHSELDPGGRRKDWLQDSGGADQFLRFVRDELFPKIESTYRTLPHRTIVGHSFGGLVVLHALLEAPQMFNSYIAIDPSLWWDDQVLVKRAREVLVDKNARRGSVYISLANSPNLGVSDPRINVDAGRAFASMLADGAPPTFRTKMQYFEAEDHGSVPLQSLYHGLLSIFDGYKISFEDVIADPSLVKTHYEALSEQLGIPLLAPESLVDGMGAHLLNEVNEVEKATVLFKINAANYPASSNAKWRLKMLSPEANQEFEVKPEILAEYVGVYEFSPTFRISVRLEKGKLITQATSQSPVRIFAESESKFFLKIVNAQLSFMRDASGKVTELVLHQNGMDQPGKKIE